MERQKEPVYLEGRLYIRSGSSVFALQGIELTRKLTEMTGGNWLDREVDEGDCDSLDAEALHYFVQKGISSHRMTETYAKVGREELMRSYDLMGTNGRPLLAGTILFHPRPTHFCPGAYINIGMFNDDGRLLRDEQVTGPVICQAERALQVLYDKFIPGTLVYDGTFSILTFRYPREALREALLNAVVHRDYFGSAAVAVKVFPNKIVIMNSGELPHGWNIDTLTGPHVSFPYNPRLAQAFYQAGLIEKWGQGVPSIQSICLEAKNPLPQWRLIPGLVELTILPNRVVIPAISDVHPLGVELTPDELRVFQQIVKSEQQSSVDVAKALGLSVHTVRHLTDALKEKGVIARNGSDRSGHWQIINAGVKE